MNIRMASPKDISQLESFFSTYITRDNKAVYNKEFLCPFGLRAAVKRGSVILLEKESAIIAAARIYHKKNDTISLYQFAVSKRERGKNRMRFLLSQLGLPVLSACPTGNEFNMYYIKSNWSFVEAKKGLNIWLLD
jgi:hypothetical protein